MPPKTLKQQADDMRDYMQCGPRTMLKKQEDQFRQAMCKEDIQAAHGASAVGWTTTVRPGDSVIPELDAEINRQPGKTFILIGGFHGAAPSEDHIGGWKEGIGEVNTKAYAKYMKKFDEKYGKGKVIYRDYGAAGRTAVVNDLCDPGKVVFFSGCYNGYFAYKQVADVQALEQLTRQSQGIVQHFLDGPAAPPQPKTKKKTKAKVLEVDESGGDGLDGRDGQPYDGDHLPDGMNFFSGAS